MAVSGIGGSDEMMRLIVALVKAAGGVVEVSAGSVREFEPGDGVLVEQAGDRIILRAIGKNSKVLWLGHKAPPVEEAQVFTAESPAAADKPWIVTDEVLAAAEASFRGKQ